MQYNEEDDNKDSVLTRKSIVLYVNLKFLQLIRQFVNERELW